MNLKISLPILFAFIVLFSQCSKEENLPVQEEPYVPQLVLPEQVHDYLGYTLPDHFNGAGLGFFSAVVTGTNEEATLGRVLFYDTKLSINNEVSCASCHHQENAFSDPEVLSKGVNGPTKRHSISLVNLRYVRRFFWDLRTLTLTAQVLEPIEDSIEMGSNLEDLIVELGDTDYYPALFEAAFGDEAITESRIAVALVRFLSSIVSYQSKFDEGVEQDFANYTPLEKQGRALFFNGTLNCNQCHFSVNFYNTQALNNGLESNPIDLGFGQVSGEEADFGKFKVPTLRNIAVTAPYMHDGRFATLREVLEHYNSGIQAHPYLDERLAADNENGGPPIRHNLTDNELDALEAFLGTFTDEEMLTDEKFSNPFR